MRIEQWTDKYRYKRDREIKIFKREKQGDRGKEIERDKINKKIDVRCIDK